MNQTVEKDNTFLIDGPASVLVVSGKVEVFGFSLKYARKVVIREGKRLPFFVDEKANFDVSLGANAVVEVVDGDTIPPSWAESFDLLMSFEKRPVSAMVIGKVDCGKTSFCTYLINRLIGAKQKVAILDGDLGQSDIGPPCTVAYAFAARPLTELYSLEAENGFFVGVTSPSEAVNKTVEGMALMKKEVLGKGADFVVVNTDGWVEGEAAAQYKSMLAEKLEPDVVLCIQQKDELQPLAAALGKFRTAMVESPSAVGQRSAEKRKNLRELSYAKYLVDAKVKSLPVSHVTVEEKSVLSKSDGEERGFLLGLFDSQRRFLGIGVLREIDHSRKTLKVLTSVATKPAIIQVGKVRLDENFREIPDFF
jgi:polynucleotide 5'-hydroxyl-kinase GRC3/NOL9